MTLDWGFSCTHFRIWLDHNCSDEVLEYFYAPVHPVHSWQRYLAGVYVLHRNIFDLCAEERLFWDVSVTDVA